MDFFVRYKCKSRRFTGDKSRDLHATDGGKDIARRAAELRICALDSFTIQTSSCLNPNAIIATFDQFFNALLKNSLENFCIIRTFLSTIE